MSTSHVCIYFINWKQLDDLYLYHMSKSNVKDNLCRSELIKVRLFDENFFCFLQEIIPLWSLDNELRCFWGWKTLDLSHSLSLLCPTNILSFFLHRVLCWLWLWVLTAARITLIWPELGWTETPRVSTVPWLHSSTAHYNPTSNAGTSINYVQSSFYIQACSWIYIRNYLLSNGKWVLSRFFPFQAGYHYLRM